MGEYSGNTIVPFPSYNSDLSRQTNSRENLTSHYSLTGQVMINPPRDEISRNKEPDHFISLEGKVIMQHDGTFFAKGARAFVNNKDLYDVFISGLFPRGAQALSFDVFSQNPKWSDIRVHGTTNGFNEYVVEIMPLPERIMKYSRSIFSVPEFIATIDNEAFPVKEGDLKPIGNGSIYMTAQEAPVSFYQRVLGRVVGFGF